MTTRNFTNDTTVTAKTDLSNFSKKDLNWLLGSDEQPKYTPTELKNVTQKALADDLHTELVSVAPRKGTKMSDGTTVVKGPRVFVPRDSKNTACAASAKTNLIKALMNGKKTIEQARLVVAGNPTLAAYWGETFEQDLTNALSGVRPAAVRSAAAALRKAEAARIKAEKVATRPAVIQVEVELDEAVA